MGLVKINTGENTVYSLEGNVAAGKTSWGVELATTGLIGFLPEPLSVWQNNYPENILDMFYKDQKRWAFTFQLCAFTTRAKTHADVLAMFDHSQVVIDRSIYSDKNIFAKLLHEDGMMTDTEYQIYTDMWTWIQSQWCIEPEKIIYIKTPPEICLKRINERNRGEESSIPLEYLQKLHNLHEEWLSGRDDVITIDGSKPINVTTLLEKLNIS